MSGSIVAQVMFTIGEFATIGRVSQRMLRHYDQLGLLRPDRVDPHSGYRYYATAQIPRLNRLVALKELGFSLDEIGKLLGGVDADQLQAMYRDRQAELERRIGADRARLVRVAARLRLIDQETTMNQLPITVTALPAVRLVQLVGNAASNDHADVGPVMHELYTGLFAAIGAAGIEPAGPAIAHYRTLDDGGLECAAGIVVAADLTAPAVGELVFADLPAVEQAAVYRFSGQPAGIDEAYQSLGLWLDEHGHRTDGTARETTTDMDDDGWTVDVALPITG